MLAAAGAGTGALLNRLFGLPEKEATLAEIMAAMNRDSAEGFGMLLQKVLRMCEVPTHLRVVAKDPSEPAIKW